MGRTTATVPVTVVPDIATSDDHAASAIVALQNAPDIPGKNSTVTPGMLAAECASAAPSTKAGDLAQAPDGFTAAVPPPEPNAVAHDATANISDSRKRPAEDDDDGEWTKRLERRVRNREHAKRSRLRKKFLLESLQDQIHGLQDQVNKLKKVLREELPDASKADQLIAEICGRETDGNGNELCCKPVPMPSGFGVGRHHAVKTVMEPDYRLVSALSGSQQNFVISDPSLPDNPIVHVSDGFLALTGYRLDQVLGRNCRFLQGPGTDQKAVDVIREGVEKGIDSSVCMLNYKADGTPFWNQVFVAALRDAENNVVNYIGVQCEVGKAVVEKQKHRAADLAARQKNNRIAKDERRKKKKPKRNEK